MHWADTLIGFNACPDLFFILLNYCDFVLYENPKISALINGDKLYALNIALAK